MITKVVKGDSIREALRADTWNAFVDAANDYQRRSGRSPNDIHTPYESPHLTVMVKNSTGSNVVKGAILIPTQPLVLPGGNEVEFRTRQGWDTKVPATEDFGTFVVTAHPIPDGEMGLAYCSGTCAVKVDVTDDEIQFADIEDAETAHLKSAYHGTARILWKEDGTGVKWAVVRLGHHRDVNLLGKTTGAVTAGGTGSVAVYFEDGSTGNTIEDVYLTWMHGDEGISADKQVQITWFSYERRWRFTGAECEGEGGGGGPVENQWLNGSGQPMTWGDGSPATFTVP